MRRRSAATSACSGRSSAGCSSSRKGSGCSISSSRSASTRAPPGAPETSPSVDPSWRSREQTLVLRAFGLYFQLANLAEQHHRLRRRREDAHDRPPARESLADAFAQLVGAVRRASSGTVPSAISIRLVLTAHPTEATRRTVLLAHIRIAEQLQALDDPRISPAEVREAEQRIAEEVTLLWQTDEVRHDSLRVADEIRHGLWFFEYSLMSAAVELLGDWRERWPEAPPPLLFGTWIGGDLDGNPNAGPETIAEAMARSRSRGSRPVSQRGPGARGRAVRLAGARRCRATSWSRHSVRDERELPEYAAEIGARNERRAVPPEALVHVVAARQRRLRPSRRAAAATCA